ncbi:uncharacterized protein METZ01_LOCUS337791, partial [marine metagenome]
MGKSGISWIVSVVLFGLTAIGGQMSDTRARKKYRSQEWFDNSNNPEMTALYIERYLNQEYTREELQGDRPVIGIAQTGS